MDRGWADPAALAFRLACANQAELLGGDLISSLMRSRHERGPRRQGNDGGRAGVR